MAIFIINIRANDHDIQHNIPIKNQCVKSHKVTSAANSQQHNMR